MRKRFLSRDAHTTKVLHPHEEALLLLPNNLNLGKSHYRLCLQSNHHSNITIVIIINVNMSQQVNILREPV